MKSYNELIQIPTFEERFKYLQIFGLVGRETFGYDRYLNQMLYTSKVWRKLRNDIIIRDDANDLGLDGFKIGGKIYIHHINPISKDDILNGNPMVYDPNNLVCSSEDTHKAIHYGSLDSLVTTLIERKPGDTCPWRK